MATYIHVITATKVPQNRGSDSTPFSEYASDPNASSAFGPDQDTMFLPVEDSAQPVVNEILLNVVRVLTQSDLGADVHGEYISGDEVWRKTWTTEAQDLETARSLKEFELQESEDAAVAVGYTVGQFVFPFVEEFFRLLADRHYWLDIAITDGAVPANTEITFSDRQGKEVSVGLATLRNNFRQFGKEYLIIQEKTVSAGDALEASTTLAEIDAVTWSM